MRASLSGWLGGCLCAGEWMPIWTTVSAVPTHKVDFPCLDELLSSILWERVLGDLLMHDREPGWSGVGCKEEEGIGYFCLLCAMGR